VEWVVREGVGAGGRNCEICYDKFHKTMCWELGMKTNQLPVCFGDVHFSRELKLLIAASYNHLPIKFSLLPYCRE
jgi:hypothetical protein